MTDFGLHVAKIRHVFLNVQKITVYDKEVIIPKYANTAICLLDLSDTG